MQGLSAALLQTKANPLAWPRRPSGATNYRHQELSVTLLQVKAERPEWYLAVVCGALLRVVEEASRRAAEYMGFLEKGQLPPARLTLTSFTEDLCLEGWPPVASHASALCRQLHLWQLCLCRHYKTGVWQCHHALYIDFGNLFPGKRATPHLCGAVLAP